MRERARARERERERASASESERERERARESERERERARESERERKRAKESERERERARESERHTHTIYCFTRRLSHRPRRRLEAPAALDGLIQLPGNHKIHRHLALITEGLFTLHLTPGYRRSIHSF